MLAHASGFFNESKLMNADTQKGFKRVAKSKFRINDVHTNNPQVDKSQVGKSL